MDLIKWSLDAIRSSSKELSWMEERRLEWAPLLASRLRYLIDGAPFIVICDEDRDWFESYLLRSINRKGSHRPILPFISLKSLYPRLNDINSKEEISLLDDMLSISFPNGFVYFYIGKSSSKLCAIAKNRTSSYMWLFDEQAENSFYLSSTDENLDFKLLSMFRLFDRTIDAVLFGQVEL